MGLFSSISSAFSSLFGSTPQVGDEDRQIPRGAVSEEKVKSAVPMPAFLPWIDHLQNVGETLEMRMVYRQMFNDPNVKAAFFAKIFAVMGQDLSVRPSKWAKKKDPKRAQVISEFVEWNLKHAMEFGVPGLIWEILSGAGISGYSVCEKVWDEPENRGRWKGKRPLRRLKSKDVDQDIVPIIDAYGNVTAIKGLRYNPGQLWNPQEFLIYRHLGLYGNPLGMSDFRAAYGSYWMLDTALKLRAMAVDKRTLPIVWATYPTGQIGMQSTVETALQTLRSRNWIAVPEGVKLEVLEIARGADGVFDSFCNTMQERIFLAIAGATLQQVQGGAGTMRGSSAVHKDTADLFKWFLTQAIVQMLNDRHHGLIPDIVDRNFSGVEDYPYASLSGVDDTELKESLAIDQGLQQIIQPMNKVLDLEELSERYSRKFKDAPMPPGGGMGAMGPGGTPMPGQANGGGQPLDPEAAQSQLANMPPDQAQQLNQMLGGAAA